MNKFSKLLIDLFIRKILAFWRGFFVYQRKN